MSTPNDPYGQQPQQGYGQAPSYGQQPQQGYGQAPAYGQQQYGAAPAYGSAPQAGGYGAAPGPVSRPSTVQYAVYLMYAGAALAIVQMLLAFVLIGQTRLLVEEELASQGLSGSDIPSGAVDTAITFGIVVGVISGVVGASLWILNAVFCGRGANWSRIFGTVLAGLYVISFLISLTSAAPAVTRVVSVLSLLVAIAAVVLLWQRPSNLFFQQAGAARAAR
ncbi:hypothetical protein GCM10028777_04460 [Angustibacter speluncae]